MGAREIAAKKLERKWGKRSRRMKGTAVEGF